MNILVTGGAGFIGSHLVERLLGAGHTVIAIDDLSTGKIKNLQNTINNPKFKFICCSILDENTMSSLIEKCDTIYHLAAAVGVQLIVDKPIHTIETNIHGSSVVLKLANKFRVPVFIASTSEVYGKSQDLPFKEDGDVTYGCTKYSRWSYACSKSIDEFLGLAYYEEYALPVTICRFFNTIGPRQTGFYGMVVPRFVRSALHNEEIKIYGTGEQSRCFANVFDVLDGVTALMNTPLSYGQVFNVGTQESITINDLAKKIIDMTNSKSQIRHITYEEAYGKPFDDMMKRIPDLSKIQKIINYNPSRSLSTTLQSIIQYEKLY